MIDMEENYSNIEKYYTKYLKQYDIKLPKLKNSQGQYTKDALVLVFLANNYPNNKTVTKEELTNFVRQYYPNISDVQQARHLGMQKGWFIASGNRGDINNIPNGCYKLISLEKPYPSFSKRRTGLSFDSFEDLKKHYEYKCACCGSEEGKPHRYNTNVIVKLQQGHMNPTKDLVVGNIIPQCQICNQPDKNNWIYDFNGRVVGIAPTSNGKKMCKKMYEDLTPEEQDELIKELEKIKFSPVV